jgi:dUTP pyrophosphatase
MTVSYTNDGDLVSKCEPINANTLQIKTKTNEILQIKKLSENAKLPSRATPESIGYDLYATNQVTVPKLDNGLISTGLAMTPPKGCYIRIAPRSGLALKKNIQIGAGVIDPDYTGEIKVVLINNGKEDFKVKPGDKIAQIILEQAKTPPIKVLQHLKPTVRQDKGFGSTSSVETQENSANSNICESNPKTPRYKKISTNSENLIVLPKIMERPPGCSFIGSKPTTALVTLGQLDGPSTEVIIDSGSDITLVSPKALSTMTEQPKHHQGKKVTLSQVTAKISIDGYVDLPLFFDTENGPIQANVEAYVVKGMSTPLILGNDFADQYSLSIDRKGWRIIADLAILEELSN